MSLSHYKNPRKKRKKHPPFPAQGTRPGRRGPLCGHAPGASKSRAPGRPRNRRRTWILELDGCLGHVRISFGGFLSCFWGIWSYCWGICWLKWRLRARRSLSCSSFLVELPRNCGVWIVGGFLRDVAKIVWGIELDFTNPFFWIWGSILGMQQTGMQPWMAIRD